MGRAQLGYLPGLRMFRSMFQANKEELLIFWWPGSVSKKGETHAFNVVSGFKAVSKL